VQNKVLEAMAMQKSVLATPQALAGLGVAPGLGVHVADGAAEFKQHARLLLAPGDTRAAAKAARACILRQHGWSGNLARLAALLDSGGDALQAPPAFAKP